MNSVFKPQVTFDSAFNTSNPFREKFGELSDSKWLQVWLSTETGCTIYGIEFPALPDQDLQNRVHGSASWEVSMRGAFAFYNFIKAGGWLDGARRFLDFGCGWGRMSRPFMRDFDLEKMYGFEPEKMRAIMARTLNPYITILSGDFSPDGSIPKDMFDLIVGYSIFSHLSEASLKAWLCEISAALRPGGRVVLTTWGARFLNRLRAEQEEMAQGKEIHWYSRHCIQTAGDIGTLISAYEAGEFIWFTGGQSKLYGEAFLGEKPLKRFLAELNLPLDVIAFDTTTLAQDAFTLRKSGG
jgi:SAM-dependent methyltransferase